jgi:4-hydroxy-tetrahydrodipicolinate synthase
MVSEVLPEQHGAKELAEAACKFGSSRGVVVINVGAESSKVAEDFAGHAETAGADAVMSIPPVSVILGEAELKEYYSRIIRAIGIPVIVQDASGYVGRPMSIAMQAQLLDEFGPERVLFKPEASPIVPRLIELRQATDGRARIFEGTGGIALVESHQHGVVGTMPGADLIHALVALWRALESGDAPKAKRIHEPRPPSSPFKPASMPSRGRKAPCNRVFSRTRLSAARSGFGSMRKLNARWISCSNG